MPSWTAATCRHAAPKPPWKRSRQRLQDLGVGRIASLVGRYYAMDRDNRWDRVESAYRLLTEAQCGLYASQSRWMVSRPPMNAARTTNSSRPPAFRPRATPTPLSMTAIRVLFMNFRADRAREMTRAFVEPDFDGFERRKTPKLADFVMLTEYSADIDTACAYPPESLTNSLGEYMQTLGKTQLRIAETEKYAHVTFFFSGGREEPYAG